ncbi:hypothetical protein BOX15_Mlig020005g1 [Macrostomum lignano]|uniref:SUEL-type lectin domain-containing protein n=1 Tax=Macrostomum lignano TaxID=282301 RepID=A0A267FNY8_9PLAT|nr:hypothetical protein BOX15_Mlig020005g1 [Macrostomum lignano]
MPTGRPTGASAARALCCFGIICASVICCCSCGSASSLNCSGPALCPEPCAAQTNCRSWWPAAGGAAARARRRQENVTCSADNCQCGAAFFAGLMKQQQIFCLEGKLAICSGTAYNLTCPAGTRLKIWYAYFGRSFDGTCHIGAVSRTASSSTSTEATPGESSAPPTISARNDQPRHPMEACLTPVLTSAIRQCDGHRNCWLQPDELLADVTECRFVPAPYLLMDFACLGASFGSTSTEQELFFRWGLLLICALFPVSLLTLLVTVQLRKKRQDAFKMNSMHLPLTRHENPEI